jgi:hypothetical protein
MKIMKNYKQFLNESKYYHEIFENSIIKENPLIKLEKELIPPTVEDIKNYVEKLKNKIEEKFEIDDLEEYENDVYKLDPHGNKDKENLLPEYESMSNFLEDLNNYGSYDSQILNDEYLKNELNDLLEEETKRLNIPDWIKFSVEESFIDYVNNFSVIEYPPFGLNKRKTFYIR